MKKAAYKAVLLFDVHAPPIEQPAQLAMEYIKKFGCDEVVVGGDLLELRSLTSKNFPADRDRINVRGELKSAYKAGRNIFKALKAKRRKLTYLGGNHEDRIERYIDENLQFEGLIELPLGMGLDHLNVEWIPWAWEESFHKIGNLHIIHGWYHKNIWHAKKHLEWAGDNIVYGHLHTLQQFSHITRFKGPTAAWSIGCLCRLNPAWMRGRPSNFANSFAVVYFQENGNFNLYNIVILRDRRGRYSALSPEGERLI